MLNHLLKHIEDKKESYAQRGLTETEIRMETVSRIYHKILISSANYSYLSFCEFHLLSKYELLK